VRVAFATAAGVPEGRVDDQAVAALVGAEFRVWSDQAIDWSEYDRVVLRSVWDYTTRAAEFVDWCRRIGAERLRNVPELVAFNADKRYLAALKAPTVPTGYVGPGNPLPSLRGEVVVKPTISAGARDTGRFPPARHAEAIALIEAIRASGRTAMVQPYLPAVGEEGETALVFLGGELSHVLNKRPILRGEGIAPLANGALPAAAVMFEDDLVSAASATAAQSALADAVLVEIAERFGTPLYARVDLVSGLDGAPLLLELEVIEPALYLETTAGSTEAFAAAILTS
jgi:glutathione synthase/RimK-type ligase-like ATP-grasp enzyme